MKKPTTTSTAMLLTIGCFALCPAVRAVSPPPDGGYPGGNTAEGQNALFSLTTGAFNTALGFLSLRSDTTGSFNTATGAGALLANTGANNTAIGAAALLSNTTGSNNTALGASAGTDPDIGSNNVYIADPGFPGDQNVISIGGIAASGTPYDNTYIGGIYGQNVNAGTALLVYVDTDGHLATNPVNASGSKLRIRDPQGAQPQATSNEFQKQQTRIAELESTIARLKSTDAKQEATIAKQQRQIESLTADLQRVSARIETSRPAPQLATNP